jgi:uncharacterized protein (DUF427 family)
MTTQSQPSTQKERVKDYPSPGAVVDSAEHIRVVFNDQVVAETRRAKRVLERGLPPAYYIPPEDIRMEHLHRTARHTTCPWKGEASYYTVRVGGKVAEDAAWTYLDPTPALAEARGYVAFYPSAMDACFVDGEQVQANESSYYGGWITGKVAGPFGG